MIYTIKRDRNGKMRLEIKSHKQHNNKGENKGNENIYVLFLFLFAHYNFGGQRIQFSRQTHTHTSIIRLLSSLFAQCMLLMLQLQLGKSSTNVQLVAASVYLCDDMHVLYIHNCTQWCITHAHIHTQSEYQKMRKCYHINSIQLLLLFCDDSLLISATMLTFTLHTDYVL